MRAVIESAACMVLAVLAAGLIAGSGCKKKAEEGHEEPAAGGQVFKGTVTVVDVFSSDYLETSTVTSNGGLMTVRCRGNFMYPLKPGDRIQIRGRVRGCNRKNNVVFVDLDETVLLKHIAKPTPN